MALQINHVLIVAVVEWTAIAGATLSPAESHGA
jgi:hypothetical protein